MFQAGDVGGRVKTLTRMHGLTKNWIEIFHFLKIGRKCRFLAGSFIWAGVFSSLYGLPTRPLFLKPAADTSDRPDPVPLVPRFTGTGRPELSATASAASTSATAPSASFHFRCLSSFRTLPRKNHARESAAGFLPSRRFCWAQVQTGGAITAKPDACLPIIKIIESQENRLPSDNLYSDYRKSG